VWKCVEESPLWRSWRQSPPWYPGPPPGRRTRFPPDAGAVRGSGVLIGAPLRYFDPTHPELAGRVRPARDLDFEGRIRELPPALRLRDKSSLGLAGLAIAAGHEGPPGVAPGAELQPIGPVRESTRGPLIRWLVDQGTGVIFLPEMLLVSDYVDSLTNAIRYALARDVVVILNSAATAKLPPEAVHGVLLVSAVDDRDMLSTFAKGRPAHIAAPGGFGALTTLAPVESSANGYAPLIAGPQEQATALVAGAVAAIRAAYPELNAASVIDRILRTARPLDPPDGAPVPDFGMIDVSAAIEADLPPVEVNPLGTPLPFDPALAAKEDEQFPDLAYNNPSEANNTRLYLALGVLAGGAAAFVLVPVAVLVLTLLVYRRRRSRTG
jgi:membrane-anchored mycosin MYCP